MPQFAVKPTIAKIKCHCHAQRSIAEKGIGAVNVPFGSHQQRKKIKMSRSIVVLLIR